MEELYFCQFCRKIIVGWNNVKQVADRVGYGTDAELVDISDGQGPTNVFTEENKNHLSYFFICKKCLKDAYPGILKEKE